MYQPKIRDENVRKLYHQKMQMKKPMSHILDEILNDYFNKNQVEDTEGGKKNP